MSNAKDVVFTTIEMELAWRESKRAFDEFDSKTLAMNPKQRMESNIIPVEDPGTLEQFTESRLKAFADVSHGDVVLIEGKELKRVKAAYKQPKQFKAI